MPGDARQQAEEIAGGADANLATVRALAEDLRDRGQTSAIAPMLIAVARRALYHGWEAAHRTELADTLRDHQQFGYARKLIGRVRRECGDSERLRQQHALTTYKDMELPAARRLDRALGILTEGGPLELNKSAETLGIAGSIYKRRWEVDTKRADLESALRCYGRGFELEDDPDHWYAGINAAFVADQLAALEDQALGSSSAAAALRERADTIRDQIIQKPPPSGAWSAATLGEAYFGRGRFEEARDHLTSYAKDTPEVWRRETTTMQLAALGQLRRFEASDVAMVLAPLVGLQGAAIRRALTGKVGLALSGGGFRASLFHIGMLARLAECNVLRHVEVLSCVSGGSILGAFYYLKLRALLQSKEDGDITDEDYVRLVRDVAEEFLDGVRKNLRGQLFGDVADNWKMMASAYSRTDRTGGLLDELFFSTVDKEPAIEPKEPWRMTDLFVTPKGTDDFSLRYENWLRAAKVPMLVLNATTLNTGHSWQFTASWMGEPPVGADEQVDASRRLRRVYYRDAPEQHRKPRLGKAVSASAGVPGVFPPVTLSELYDGIDVELVDGGAHDNQGIASVLEQDCTVVLVSDASGQMRDANHPSRRLLGVALRSNSVLMSRVRGSQYSELMSRRRSGALRGLMVVHLKKELASPPRDWSKCQEPYDPEDDALAPGTGARRHYAIDEQVQRALSELRTDLDAFSDDEAYSLMACGYEMTRYELSTVPGLSPGDPKLEKAVEWPFAPALANLAGAADEGKLLRALRPGHAKFFRRIVAWRQRPKGRFGRFLDKTKLPAVPGLATRAAKTVVVAPIRAIVSAPLSIVGAAGTWIARRLPGG